MSSLPPVLVELKANSSEFMAKLGEARHEVSKLGTESAGHMQKFAAFGKAALFGIAGAAAVVGAGSLEMADKFETSHAKLEAALKGAGTSMDVWGSQIKNANKYMEGLGFTNAQNEDALAKLTIALGDPSKALQVMGTAADLARAKNISLADAGTAVAKAMEGNSRALKQMGIDLPVNAKSAEGLKVAQNNVRLATEAYHTQLTRLHEKHTVTKADLEAVKTAHDRLKFAQSQLSDAQRAGTTILDELNKRLGGQSQQYTETFAGKVTVLKTQIEDLGVKIGLALIPILERAVTVTMDVVTWFEKHRTIAEALGIVVGVALVAAIGAYIVTMAAAAVATIAATWPILAIVAAVAAVVVGVLELVKHWHAIWTDVSRFVREHSLIIAAAMAILFGPIGLLIAAGGELAMHWHAVWGGIKSVTADVVGGVTGGFHDIIGAGRQVVAWIVDKLLAAFGFIVHGAASAFGWVPGIGGKLKGAAKAFDNFRDQVNYALDGIHKNVMINVDAKVSAAANAALHGAAPGTVGHAYAKGTDYAPGGMALVGENGPEVVNLPRGSKVYPHGSGPSGGGDVHVHFDGPVYGADSNELARTVRDALLRMQNRGGSLGFAAS